MAVSLKTSKDYGYDLLTLFKVPVEIIDMAKSAGVVCDTATPGSIYFKDSVGTIFASAPLKTQALSLAKQGQLGPQSAEAIKYTLLDAMSKYLKFDPKVVMQSKSSTSQHDPLKVLAGISKKEPAPNPTPATTVGSVGKNLHKVTTPVPLSEASDVYHPVKGTSKGSVYYVVAMLKGMNIAIRTKTNAISLRAEGADLSKYKNALEEMGFKVKPDYASAHYEVSAQAMAAKTVGAILGRLNLTNLIKVGDVHQLMGL